MKSKGFTLIELLAVIVILAIIALIATPIILGIISNAKEASQQRSAELYFSAIDLAVARKNLTEGFEPTECTIASGVVTCSGKELEVEVQGDTPVSGTLKFENNKLTVGTELIFKEFKAILKADGTIEIIKLGNETSNSGIEVGKLNSVCEPAETQHFQTTAMEPGYEYNCTVDPNADPYTFYVLNKSGNQINLIMDRNINSDGTPATSSITKSGDNVYNVVDDWSNSEIFQELTGKTYDSDVWEDFLTQRSLGPIIPMRFLDEATKNWTNLNPMTINTYEVADPKNTVAMAESYVSYARLPKESEIARYNPSTQEYAYLYDNLTNTNDCMDDMGETISCNLPTALESMNFGSYWTQNYNGDENPHIFVIQSSPIFGYAPEGYFEGVTGIRPVITLDIQ